VFGLIGVKTFWIPALLMVAIFFISFRLVRIEKEISAKSGT
jgi:hypothetical protein